MAIKTQKRQWTFGKSKIRINNLSVIIMGTWKGPKVIVKYVIASFQGSKMVFDLRQFLQFGSSVSFQTLGRSKIGL